MSNILELVDFDLVDRVGSAMLSAARRELGIDDPGIVIKFGGVSDSTILSMYVAAIGIQAFAMSDVTKDKRGKIFEVSSRLFYMYLDEYDERIDNVMSPAND